MTDFYTKLKDFLNTRDRFCRINGMEITEIREGYAEAVLSADERHLNGHDFIQGGALCTLADYAFAAAVNSFGFRAVSMNMNVSFVRPGTGSRFTARAEKISKGHRTALFEVKVMDEREKLVLHATINGFLSDEPVFPEETQK